MTCNDCMADISHCRCALGLGTPEQQEKERKFWTKKETMTRPAITPEFIRAAGPSSLYMRKRDIAAALAELEADNAVLLQTVQSGTCCFLSIPTDNTQHDPDCPSTLPHPGTALLARHAEQLAAKDAEIGRLRKGLEEIAEPEAPYGHSSADVRMGWHSGYEHQAKKARKFLTGASK